jgi:hypothetical protein
MDTILGILPGESYSCVHELRIYLCAYKIYQHPPYYLYKLQIGLGVGKLGNRHESHVHAAMQPPEKSGAEWSWGQCGRTLGWPARHRLALVGFWLGLGGSHVSARPRFGV